MLFVLSCSVLEIELLLWKFEEEDDISKVSAQSFCSYSCYIFIVFYT